MNIYSTVLIDHKGMSYPTIECDAKLKVQSGTENLDEKINCMKIPENAKHRIADIFKWLIQKSRDCPEGENITFVNDQIARLLDLVDSMCVSNEFGLHAEQAETTANLSETGAANNTKSVEGYATSFPIRHEQGQHIPAIHGSNNLDQLLLQTGEEAHAVLRYSDTPVDWIDLQIDNRKVRLSIDEGAEENTLRLFAGAGISPADAQVHMDGVHACAQLMVRLTNLRKLVESVLEEKHTH